MSFSHLGFSLLFLKNIFKPFLIFFCTRIYSTFQLSWQLTKQSCSSVCSLDFIFQQYLKFWAGKRFFQLKTSWSRNLTFIKSGLPTSRTHWQSSVAAAKNCQTIYQPGLFPVTMNNKQHLTFKEHCIFCLLKQLVISGTAHQPLQWRLHMAVQETWTFRSEIFVVHCCQQPGPPGIHWSLSLNNFFPSYHNSFYVTLLKMHCCYKLLS